MTADWYSTTEAARKLKIRRATLHWWIDKGYVTAPRDRIGRNLVWTDVEIARVKAEREIARKTVTPGRPRKKREGKKR